jgi:hypothetical protein
MIQWPLGGDGQDMAGVLAYDAGLLAPGGRLRGMGCLCHRAALLIETM